MRASKTLVWIARILIAAVLAMNLVCALEFILRPRLYQGAYELSGEVGAAVISGFGILFLMWQVPYFFAVADPTRHKISLISALLMQAIGFVGESLLYRTISPDHALLRSSVLRFIIFDGGGLLGLIIALLLVRAAKKNSGKAELDHRTGTTNC